jgi:hypothetical protein
MRETMRSLGRYLWANKIWWMTPITVVLVLFGLLVFLAERSSVAPFNYVLF